MIRRQAEYILSQLNSAPVGSDMAGVILSANTAWERMNGSQPVLGEVVDTTDSEGNERLIVRFDQARDGEVLRGLPVEVRRAS
jgi:hypothetical protein